MPVLVADTSSLEEIDEALQHLRAIPVDERGPAWSAYLDKMLELRKAKSHES